jgi:alpha-tubulin suppressor-like RCC1 family protein
MAATLNGGCVAFRRASLCLIGSVLLLAGCKENGTGPTAPCGLGSTCSGSAKLATLTLSPAFDTLLKGDKAQIVFAATNSSGAAVTGVTVSYKSSDTSVAKVDTSGLVSAVGVGASTITIAAGGLKASSHLTVLSPTVVLLSAGSDYTCMVITLGRGFCWGQDGLGELAASTSTTCFDSASASAIPCATSPIAMSGGVRFTSMATGAAEACGLSGGVAYCWGDNSVGELGIGVAGGGATSPTKVAGALSFSEIAAGAEHVCAIASGSRVFCWGNDQLGQLGDTGIVSSTTPIPVDSAGVEMSFTSVAAGAGHTCALKSGGAAYCWGDNSFGQLGTGTPASHSTPVTVAGGLSFASLTAGGTHTCGLTSAGAAFCWGDNSFGELGNGTSGAPQGAPVAVAGGHTFSEITAGDGFTCGVSGTTVYCWGNNSDGQIGAGAALLGGTFTAPSAVVTSLTFAYVSAGKRHVCAIVANGAGAACWGSNIFGALGNSLQAATSGVPVMVGTPLS